MLPCGNIPICNGAFLHAAQSRCCACRSSHPPARLRPEPPAGLDPVEQRVWREVIDAVPVYWADTAGQLILRRRAAEAAVSESQEIRLRELRAQGRDDSEDAAELIAAHGAVAKI